jgi:capsular polysaccharide transport system permease protein
LTGLASTGSTTSDSYIVLSYLASRELLEAVDGQLDLRGVYSSRDVDPLSRLASGAAVEDFLKYWSRRIHTQFDPTSGIIEFEVQSFSPEHAREIAAVVLRLTQTLVNELSANARSDALRFAREEVQLQEARLRQALGAIRDFRATEQSVDPSASAALEIELIASLEARLIDVNARIAALRQTLDETAPSLSALRRNADALAAQIVERREAIGSEILGESGVSAVTRQLARYEELEVERSLAQQAYASALASLEQARRDADRQQRYLAIHLRPQFAESAKYPRSLRNILILGFALVAAWGIGTLITYSVRDHLT